jgi:PAS domain S-box-containing protein
VDGEWWGFVGFDECERERVWEMPEQGAVRWTSKMIATVIREHSSQFALRRSERLLAHAQKAANAGVYDLNIVTRGLIGSEGAYRVLGVSREEFGGNLESFIRLCVYPEDRRDFERTVERAIEGKHDDRIEFRVVRGDGEVRNILADGRIMEDREGRPVRMVGIIQDITGLRESEQKLEQTELRWRSVLENMPDYLIIVDRPGRILFANRPIRGVPVAELSGKSVYDFIDPAYRDEARKCIDYVFASASASRFESRFTERGGTVWYTSRVGPQKRGDEVVAATIVTSDVTRQVESEEELRISARQLRALASRLHTIREQESANISREIHDELGQALTVLKMDVSWVRRRLTKEDGPEENRELLERLDDMARDIDGTIAAVRRISTQLRPGILDDLGLIGALEWHAGVFEERTGIRCDFVRSLPDVQMSSDQSSAVFRIFQEILTNVARHSGADSVDVDLKVDRGALVVRVNDNGRGITEEERKESRSLGILGMRERALVCGGELAIRGEEGVGTEVTLRIPLDAGERSDTEDQV